MKESSLPGFGSQSRASEDNEYTVGSNWTYTHSNFHNKAHLDNDSSAMSLGMWCPINLATQQPAFNGEGNRIKYGQFVFPGIGVVVDFEGFNGIVVALWAAQNIFHQTVQSIEPPETDNKKITRLGSLVQINFRTHAFCKNNPIV